MSCIIVFVFLLFSSSPPVSGVLEVSTLCCKSALGLDTANRVRCGPVRTKKDLTSASHIWRWWWPKDADFCALKLWIFCGRLTALLSFRENWGQAIYRCWFSSRNDLTAFFCLTEGQLQKFRLTKTFPADFFPVIWVVNVIVRRLDFKLKAGHKRGIIRKNTRSNT